MKAHLLIFSTILITAVGCSNANRSASTDDIDKNASTPEQPIPDNGPKGTPSFETTTHDFGKVIDGESVQHKFVFKNTGKGDLVIANVQAHCGCTTPEWTREIIPAGGEGFIMATFNSSGKGGKEGVKQEKGVTVEFSTSTVETVELTLKSTVYTKE